MPSTTVGPTVQDLSEVRWGPDGIGPVAWDTPLVEALGALEGLIGEPTEVTETEDPNCGYAATARWTDELVIIFDAGGLSSLEVEGAYFLANTLGLTTGMDMEGLVDQYGAELLGPLSFSSVEGATHTFSLFAGSPTIRVTGYAGGDAEQPTLLPVARVLEPTWMRCFA